MSCIDGVGMPVSGGVGHVVALQHCAPLKVLPDASPEPFRLSDIQWKELVVKNASKDIYTRSVHPLIKPIGDKYEVLLLAVL